MATFTVTWNAAYEADPADTDLANLLGDDVRDLKRDIAEREKIDHSWAGDGDDGKHKAIQLLTVGDPGLDANNSAIYSKAVSTIERPHFKDGGGGISEVMGFKTGAGGPAAVDGNFVGQRYFDTTNIGWHTCTATGSPGTWSADIEPKTLRLLNSTAVPAGWLLCDGTASAPDLRGRFIVGFSAADVDYDALGINDDFGEKKHALTIAELAEHDHQSPWLDGLTGSGSSPIPGARLDLAFSQDQRTGLTGSDTAHENRPPYSAHMWIIKKPV